MSEKTMKNIPILRFPEFKNAPEWEKKTLIDTTDKKVKWSFIGGPFGSNLKSSDYATDGIRVIQLQNIGDGKFLDEYKIYTSKHKADELLSNNIYPNEIILSKMGDPVARACLIPNIEPRYVMCSDGIRLVINEKLFNKFFIFSMINSSFFRDLADKTATGSTRKRIGLDDLKKLPILVPKLPEQEKIAGCLSSIDELIAAQGAKVEALKKRKKALLQQLFPIESETVPRLRFPEFRNAPEWKEKLLDDVVDYENGKAHENDIVVNGKYIVVNSKFISTEGGTLKYTNHAFSLANKNDILMVLSDIPNGRAIAKCYLVGSDDLYTVNQRICKLSTKKAISKFLFYILDRNPYLLAFDDGMKQTNLKKENVLNCQILIPENPREQQKIADCLSSIDELIAAQSAKIKALKEHRKGLMQQIFPSTTEVS